MHFETKLAGNQPVMVHRNMPANGDNGRDIQPSQMRLEDRAIVTYAVPHNTPYQEQDQGNPAQNAVRYKQVALGARKQNQSTPNFIPRCGRETPRVQLKAETRVK